MNTSHLPQSKYLDANKLGAIFSNTTNSYKFFWFGEIIKRAVQGVEVDSIRHHISKLKNQIVIKREGSTKAESWNAIK